MAEPGEAAYVAAGAPVALILGGPARSARQQLASDFQARAETWGFLELQRKLWRAVCFGFGGC